MKIGLLGTNDDVLRLAAAARDMGHEIAWVGDVRSQDAADIAELTSRPVDRSREWELLLDGAIADAVIVGGGMAPSELRTEQLRRLAAEKVPLLVVQPVCDRVLPYYELDMTRRETGGIVRHYNPIAGHPIAAELAAWVRDAHPSIGTIHQISCERRIVDDARASALSALARDVELLANVAGDIHRVTAAGPPSEGASFASLQVQMSTGGAASLRWSVRTSRFASPGLELTLIGDAGSATLRIDEGSTVHQPATWELETHAGESPERRPLEPFDSARLAIRELAEAVAQTDATRRAACSTWDAATRAMEVVDAVELSLEKGRTIDVFQQQLTERLAFRGTMAALGCGLLLVGFLAIVFVTLLGGAEGVVGRRLLPAWPVVLLAVLAFFLLLQVIPLLVHKSRQGGTPSPDDEAGP